MSLAENKTSNHPNATPIALDILMKPKGQMRFKSGYRYLHVTGAFTYRSRDCVVYKKSLVTASYVSEAMQDAGKQSCFHERDRIGSRIDHMSAMKVIDEIRDKGGKMLLFESSAVVDLSLLNQIQNVEL
jgi:hypothetical protein